MYMYTSLNRPHFGYASEVWGETQKSTTAARIVIGLSIFASRNLLSTRRKKSRLKAMFKVEKIILSENK